MTITGKRILVTGVTGWVAGPSRRRSPPTGNEVYGAARFTDASTARAARGSRACTPSASTSPAGRFDEVPADLDLVLHFAVSKAGNFDEAFRLNAEASADLMAWAATSSPNLQAFLHCSSTGGLPAEGPRAAHGDRPLGDSHRPMPGMPTYSISKIAGEVLVRHTVASGSGCRP